MFTLDHLDESNWLPYQATTHLPGGKVLVLAPHPDDEVFGCGGAIMCHVAQGDAVRVVLVTDGAAAAPPRLEKDRQEEQERLQQYVATRLHESRQAAQILGYGIPETWAYPDRHLGHEAQFTTRLREFIAAEQFDIVYAPSLHEVHPDHYALAVATIHAIQHTHCVQQICFYEIGACCAPNKLLDITPYVARKRMAVRCFTSQLAVQAYADHVAALNRYRTYTLPPAVQAAEGYYCLETEYLRSTPILAYGNHRQTQRMLELQQHADTLAHQLTNVYQSNSWRYTRILRGLKRVWNKTRNDKIK